MFACSIVTVKQNLKLTGRTTGQGDWPIVRGVTKHRTVRTGPQYSDILH